MYDPSMTLDLALARQRLEEEQKRLRDEIAAVEVEPLEPMTYGSQAAAATQVFDQNRERALRERAERELAQVDEAVARLDAGTYGICVACGRPIDPERLEALPWALYDLDCQRKVR
jgi:RNA polymerase-binding transcription factor DksA